jgi:NhaA family Na+:H+ antiporter
VPPIRARTRLFGRLSPPERRRIAAVLRQEAVGGALLVAAAAVALVWANASTGSYESVRDTVVGPSALHLDLTLGTWAADGLLAIFFFVAGLELKREFVAGDLRDPRRAALPVLAAIGGMAAPAVVYLLVNALADDGSLDGWAVPSATDIAFALAVLAVVSRALPEALRTFLLTLAVVDDLLAITIIAVFYTASPEPLALLAALVPLGLFGLLVQRRCRRAVLLLPLAFSTWVLVHESGVHPTVAGVLLAFTVPVVRSHAAGGPDAGPGLAEHFEHRLRPLSAGVAVPLFALMSAGVAVGGVDGLGDALSDPVAFGVVLGLLLGKVVGIVTSTWLVARFTRAELDASLSWWDVLGLGLLAGIGFTVSLLIGGLAFGADAARVEHVKVGILAGSLSAAACATVVLRARDRHYRGS